MEKDAEAIAKRIIADMLDDRIRRNDALLLFEEMAAAKGIPVETRKMIRKRLFG